MQNMKREAERLARAVGAKATPLERWTAADWDVIATAFAGGASLVRLHGMTISVDQWAAAARAWDEFRAMQYALTCDETAAAAAARGFTGLAEACRTQAGEWRAKAAELESSAAAAG